MMQEQLGNESVEAVFFVLPFGGGCCSNRYCVLSFCQREKLRLHVVDCTKGALFRKYMAMIRKPKFRRGVAMNPCIDCHLFMLREAKKVAEKAGAKFFVTGEVLGERPLSQNRPAMETIEKEAELVGKVLRPLSAKAMPETEAERKGWIDRNKLLGIVGRRRVEQLTLAKKYNIDFPSPAGGCYLTDVELSRRLLALMEGGKDISPEKVELVTLGRHFSVSGAVIIVGRNHEENVKLGQLAKLLRLTTAEVDDVMGPVTVIVSPKPKKPLCRAAAMLTARYADTVKGAKCAVSVKSGNKVEKIVVIAPQDTDFLAKVE
jgi:tRNA U34 2-thiouridine synthase MnmA/TrmU